MSMPIQVNSLIPVSDGEDSDSEESDTDSDSSENSSTYSDSDDEHIIEIMGSVEELKEMEELEDLEELEEPTEFNADDIKSIHLEDSLLDNLSLFKSIHISGAESDTHTIEESTNYKKMPIQKLREIAQVQGHGDVSKLKKNELLKLLGAE